MHLRCIGGPHHGDCVLVSPQDYHRVELRRFDSSRYTSVTASVNRAPDVIVDTEIKITAYTTRTITMENGRRRLHYLAPEGVSDFDALKLVFYGEEKS